MHLHFMSNKVKFFILGQQPRSTYMFLGNVALTDFVTGLAVLFGQFYPKNIRNHYICATQLGKMLNYALQK